MAKMRVMEETPHQIVLTMDEPEQGNKGCSKFAIGTTIVPVIGVGLAGLVYLNSSQFWLFWTILLVAVPMASIFRISFM
jgi:hypothetical protein